MSMATDDSCGICQRIQQIREGTNAHFVAEMESGYVVIGEHQLFRGYALLLCKEHKSELHQLEATSRRAFLEDMSVVAEAVHVAFKPRKLNYELLGNSLQHMHWHIIPRHADDPCPDGPVWVLDRKVRYAENVRPSAQELLNLKQTLLDKLTGLGRNRVIRTFTA